jgi:hypothetical protein
MNAGSERQGSHWGSRRQYRARCGTVEHWSLTSLREKLVKIGATIVTQVRYVTFQIAEVAVPRDLFREILRLIDGLRRSPPAPA